MEIRDLEFLIETIDNALAKAHNQTKELYDEKESLNNNPRWLKSRHSWIVGELSGAISFVKSQLDAEIENRKEKKFYHFWK